MEWKSLTPDEKIEWLKQEVDDLVHLVERLYGTIPLLRRAGTEAELTAPERRKLKAG